MITYLVTGGAGFIGSNFIRYMLNKYGDEIRIINLDKLTYAGNPENLASLAGQSNYRFVQGDICDETLVGTLFSQETIRCVVNFAAESHVDRSIISASEFVRTNILGTQNLLDVAKNHWANGTGYREGVRFLQVSTDEVYGSLGSEGYFTEQTPLDPHSPYSASKAGADLMVKAYYDTHNLPVNITRCSNNYGPYQFPEKLIPLIIKNCLVKKPLPIYGDGLNIRDWLYVEDHCSAIDRVLSNGKVGEVYNIGGYNEKTNIAIVKNIIAYLQHHYDSTIDESLIEYVADRKGHDRRYAIDPSKITRELGWTPQTNFAQGIGLTIKWYLDNHEWLKGL